MFNPQRVVKGKQEITMIKKTSTEDLESKSVGEIPQSDTLHSRHILE